MKTRTPAIRMAAVRTAPMLFSCAGDNQVASMTASQKSIVAED